MSLWRSDRQGSFTFNWVGTGATVAILLFLLIANYWVVGEKFDYCSITFGTIIFLGISLIPGYLVFRITKRNVMSGNIAYALTFLSLIGSLVIVSVATVKKSAKEIQNFDTLFEEYKVASFQSKKEELADDKSVENISKLSKGMEDLASGSKSRQAKALGIVGKVMQQLPLPISRNNEAVEKLVEAGGVDPRTMQDRSHILRRQGMVNAMLKTSRELDKVYMNLEPTLRAQLKKAGFEPNEIEWMVKKWRTGAMPELHAKLREADRQVAEAMLGMLQFLDASFGEWHIDNDGDLVFEMESLFTQYTQLKAKLGAAGDMQTEIHADIQSRIEAARK